ncbi:MAG: hypothetical protein Ct9H300mP31_19310 [Acidimicrobiaceae bacterium]|nr:MAG: hypothetical protein Ct9H300mP31_19310 [Acidimicrobiaceae bacterium]
MTCGGRTASPNTRRPGGHAVWGGKPFGPGHGGRQRIGLYPQDVERGGQPAEHPGEQRRPAGAPGRHHRRPATGSQRHGKDAGHDTLGDRRPRALESTCRSGRPGRCRTPDPTSPPRTVPYGLRWQTPTDRDDHQSEYRYPHAAKGPQLEACSPPITAVPKGMTTVRVATVGEITVDELRRSPPGMRFTPTPNPIPGWHPGPRSGHDSSLGKDQHGGQGGSQRPTPGRPHPRPAPLRFGIPGGRTSPIPPPILNSGHRAALPSVGGGRSGHLRDTRWVNLHA